MIKVTGFEFIPIQYDVAQKGLTKFIQLQAIKGTNWSKGMQMPSNGVAPKSKTKQIKEKEKAAAEGAKELAGFMNKLTPTISPNLYNPSMNLGSGTVQADNTRVVGPIIMPNSINANIGNLGSN
jgi:hypothetical protein